MYELDKKIDINRNSNIFLMSSAITTDNIAEALRYKMLERSRIPRILIFKDGWTKLNDSSEVPIKERINHRFDSLIGKFWTRTWLKYLLGRNATIDSITSDRTHINTIDESLNYYDSIIMPGSNTFQLMHGLKGKEELIRNKIESGSHLYIGESGGSIIAGKSSYPALIPPADYIPAYANPDNSLNLIDAEIVVHIESQNVNSPIPVIGKIANLAIRKYMSSIDDLERFQRTFMSENSNIISINDGQAIDIKNGDIRTIE